MDLMSIRRGLMAQMANAAQIKTGIYTGQGSVSAAFNIGFEPDLFIITRDSINPAPGMQNVALIKAHTVYNSLYYTGGGVLKIASYSNYIYEDDDAWGYKDDLAGFVSYATYSDGVLTLTNISSNSRCVFIDNDTYTWIAIRR